MPPAAPTRVRWLILALACGTSWLLYVHRYTANIVNVQLQTEHGYTKDDTGRLGSLFNLSYGLGQIPSGILCDAVGPHRFLSVLILLWSILLGGQALTTSFAGQGLFRFLFGAAQSGCYPSLNKSTLLWMPRSSRTTAQGLIAVVFGRGGGAAAPILMGTLLMKVCGLSWQQALLVMSGAGVIFGVVFLWLFRGSPAADPRVNEAERVMIEEGRPPPAAGASRVLPWKAAFRNRSLLLAMLMLFLSAGVDGFYSLFLGQYFFDVWKVGSKDAGILLSLPLIGGAIGGGLVGARLNDVLIRRLGSRRWGRAVVGGTGPLVAAALVLCVAGAAHPTAAGLTLLAVKFFIDWTQPTIWGTCTDLGGRFSATVLGIINSAGTLGGIVFPLIFGRVLGASKAVVELAGGGTETVTRYGPLFVLMAGVYIVIGLLWLGIDCTKAIEPADDDVART